MSGPYRKGDEVRWRHAQGSSTGEVKEIHRGRSGDSDRHSIGDASVLASLRLGSIPGRSPRSPRLARTAPRRSRCSPGSSDRPKEDVAFADQQFRGSEDDPVYIVESDDTGDRAAHKQDGLEAVSS